MRVDRREFLALRAGQPAELSCERLYMRFVDAEADGTRPRNSSIGSPPICAPPVLST